MNLTSLVTTVRRQSFSESRGVFVAEALVRFLFEFKRQRLELGRMVWSVSADALVGNLSARARSGQVIVNRDADDDARLAFIMALREARQTETAVGAPLTRLMAWVTEILLRPLVPPCFRADQIPAYEREQLSTFRV